MWLPYIFSIICLFDWIFHLIQSIKQCQLTRMFNYFVFIQDLWRFNRILTSFILIISCVGLFSSINLFKKLINALFKFIKSIFRKPIIINVPLLVYLSILYFKFSWLLPGSRRISLQDFDGQSLRTFYEQFNRYFYSSLLTKTLFIVGIYNVFKKPFIRIISRQILRIIEQQITLIRVFCLARVPTPLYLLNLLILNLVSKFYSEIPVILEIALTSSVLIYCGLTLVLLYFIVRWFWSTPEIKAELSGEITMNDVSGLNRTPVHSVFYPRTVNDVHYLIYKARSESRSISVRGQAHTMGGQTLPSRRSSKNNYICDLKYLNRIEYDPVTKEVLVQAGATWTDVIKKLNFHGRSPVIMQSYCTFSVAGTISVNAHGITSDDAMYESVVSIDYIDANGQSGQCSRDKQPELFSLMIGGYGLFGIMTRIRLKTVPNVKTDLEYIRLQVNSTFFEMIHCSSTICLSSLINFMISMISF